MTTVRSGKIAQTWQGSSFGTDNGAARTFLAKREIATIASGRRASRVPTGSAALACQASTLILDFRKRISRLRQRLADLTKLGSQVARLVPNETDQTRTLPMMTDTRTGVKRLWSRFRLRSAQKMYRFVLFCARCTADFRKKTHVRARS